MSNNKKAPAIRFKGFNEDWEERKLGDILQTLPFKAFLKVPEQDGKYEIVQQGNEPIIGYAKGSPCFDYENTVIFGDHTLSLYKPKKPFFVATDGVRIIKGRYNLNGNYLLILLEKYKPQSEGYKRYYSILSDKHCYLISNRSEQTQIGKFFSNLDNLITLQKRKCDKLILLKKAMLEQMFPKGKKSIPEIRFKGFNDDWEERKLGEVADVYDGTHQTPKYTDSGVKFVSVENITTLETTKFISQVAYDKEYSKKQAEKGDVLMTRIGNIGTTKVIETEEPLAYYVTLALLKPKQINSDFLTWLISSPEVQRDIWMRTLHIAFPKKINLGEINQVELMIPNISEQQKIGNFFRNLDHLITLHQRKLEKLKIIKKSMLDKMFI